MEEYQKLQKQRDNCQSAMIRTSGEMKAIWEAKYTYFQGKLENFNKKERGKDD